MEYVPTELYEQLLKFKNGEIDVDEIDDELISKVTSNGLVEIEFDSSYDYIKLFPYDESDQYLISIVFSDMYYTPELISSYHIQDEWSNAYIIGIFDSNNHIKLNNILYFLGLSFNDNEDNNQQILSVLDDVFPRLTEDIRDKYHELLTDSYEELIRNEVTNYTCDFFRTNFIILEKCFRYYHTTVDNLIELFNEYKPKSGQTLYKLLKKIAREDFSAGGNFGEDLYNSNPVLCQDEFNKSVSNILDSMLESIEDEIDFKDINEFRKIMKTLSNYNLNMVYPTPKNNNVRFQIFRIDPETNLIKLRIFFNRESVDGYMSLDNFKLLLYHPELFSISEE